jgi:Prokaryotic E2 family E
MLLEDDEQFLKEKGYSYTTTVENSVTHLVIHGFPFPLMYQPTQADLLIRLPAGYPQANPDMFWTRPDIMLTSGAVPQAAGAHESYLGQSWQRWSRHWGAAWRAGLDTLRTFIAAIQAELRRGV